VELKEITKPFKKAQLREIGSSEAIGNFAAKQFIGV
jgi:hypothetical protein